MSLLYRKKSYVLATCPSCIFVSAMSSRLQRITPTSLVSLICSSASFGSLIRLSVAKSRETGTLWLTNTEPGFEWWYFGTYLCKVIKVTEVPYALQGSIPGHDQCWRQFFSKAREARKWATNSAHPGRCGWQYLPWAELQHAHVRGDSKRDFQPSRYHW